MAETLIGLDAGTTGVTAVLFGFDESFGLVPLLRAYREFAQHFPEPGWVEHHAEEILEATDAVLLEVLSDKRAGDVLAIGVTNQRETVFALDRSKPGVALGPGIVWQDRRTESRCETLRALPETKDLVRSRTGLVLDPYFSGSKIEWMLENHDGLRSLAEAGGVCFGTVDALVVSHLTQDAGFVTDPTNASRTMLFDIEAGTWCEQLCTLFGVDPRWLPEVRPSRGEFGLAQVHGRSIPILGVAGDQQAALFGQGATQSGALKCTFGTGLFLLLNAGPDRPRVLDEGLLTTLALGPDGDPAFALEGSIFMGGAILQWMRDQLGILGDVADSETLAAAVPDTGGVTLVPAFTGLGAPYWDAGARAAILGLSRGSTREHIVRAGLEAIVMQNVELIELFRRETGLAIHSMRVDGGAASNDLLMQMQADRAGLRVLRPSNLEATALGAAALAACQLGRLGKHQTLEVEREFEPAPNVKRDEHLAEWRAAVARVRTS